MKYYDKKTGTNYIEFQDSNSANKELPVISLFTGAGGLDIGLENAGFQTAICVELDADCRETLRHNRPEWKLFEKGLKIESGKIQTRISGDIRDIGIGELLEEANLKKGDATLVVGGAPCQPFSNIGKKLGRKDERNGDLFLEFVRTVKEANPEGFIFENVVGITQQKHSDVISYMVDKFKGLGYGLSHTILNAANYGVPQRRERFFLIGIKGVKHPAFPLPTHFKDQKQYEGFMRSIDGKIENKFNKWISVKEAFDEIPENHSLRNDYVLMNISDKVVNRMKYIKQGKNFKAVPPNLLPNCWKNGKHQGNDTFGRLVEDLPSVTIRTAAYNPSKGMYIHPNENRGLSTVEMAKLQSFPYNWEFKVKNRDKVTLVSGGKQIGNAVPPGLAEALGKAMLLQLKSIRSKFAEKLHQHAEAN
ncbi:DNA cytosine methyltransferase [Maribacter algicola]|uniref:DNA cytosine methyltransferase n=1 Tax=Meishania litoralis TaxID=3434685 RepID=A0ACC7LHT9_9FLAO